MKNKGMKWGVMIMLVTLLWSCKKDDDTTTDGDNVSAESIHSVLGNIDDAYYLLQTDELEGDSLSFVNSGTQLDADLAARILSAGDYLYSLNYGTGILSQLQPKDDGSYEIVKEINAGLAVGTVTPRYKLADESTIMVYNVEMVYEKNVSDEVTGITSNLRLATVSLPDLSIINLTAFEIPQTAEAAEGATIGYHPMRVDVPVIAGDKIYFGLMHLDMYDETTPPPFRVPKQNGLETLVFDYPGMTNGTIVQYDSAAGHTNGYRAPSMYVDENGDVYQSNWYMSGNSFDLSNGDKTVMMKLTDGEYDTSYVFNISEALGLTSNIATVGWFYVGDGIGYMPIQIEDEGSYYKANTWSVAKIDIYNKTAVKLDVPLSYLFAYQSGIVKDGKFYMSISPIDGDAYIYEFDPSTTDATPVLKLVDDNVSIEGLY